MALEKIERDFPLKEEIRDYIRLYRELLTTPAIFPARGDCRDSP